jgi:AcrR family transcriptional regulator
MSRLVKGGHRVATGSRTKSRQGKAEQARATRGRIVEAATRLFLRDGFLTTTMAAIAAEAGVAVQTLYLAFANKTAILSAAFDTAVAGDDEQVPLPQRGWMREAIDNPDGPAGLTAFVAGAAAVMARSSPLYGVIRAAAADPEVADILARNKKERHDGFALVVESAATKPGFTTHLSPADATGVLYTVQSEETYALLVDEHGWTSQQWHDWVLRTVLAELFPGHRSANRRRTAPRPRAATRA